MIFHFFLLLFFNLYTLAMMSSAIFYYLLYDYTGETPLHHPYAALYHGEAGNRLDCQTGSTVVHYCCSEPT